MTEAFQTRPSDIIVRVDGGIVHQVDLPGDSSVRVVVFDYDNGRDGDADCADETGKVCSVAVFEPTALPDTPSPDWRAIARDLCGALSSCMDQIEQMRGMFDDGDGTIAEAVEAGDLAMEAHRQAEAAADPNYKPSEMTVYSLITDGDDCPLRCEVFKTEDEALETLRADLEAELPASQHAKLARMDAEQLSELWTETLDGTCTIEEHKIAA